MISGLELAGVNCFTLSLFVGARELRRDVGHLVLRQLTARKLASGSFNHTSVYLQDDTLHGRTYNTSPPTRNNWIVQLTTWRQHWHKMR